MRRHVTTTGCAVVAVLMAASAAAQIPSTFTNLQALPKDISRPELVLTMRGIAGALGVRCTHCHVGPDNLEGMDFATDDKPAKQIARKMLRMVRSINSEFIATLPAGDTPRQQVTCISCHRRELKPPRPLSEVLLATLNAQGVPAAIQRYRKLRAEMLDAGLYDFRETTLNIVATALRDQKRFSEALEILRLNAEIFPSSAAAQMNLGGTAVQNNDLALAQESYERALQLDPANAVARKALEALKAKRAK